MYVVEFFGEAIFPRKLHYRCLASLKYTSAIYLKKETLPCVSEQPWMAAPLIF